MHGVCAERSQALALEVVASRRTNARALEAEAFRRVYSGSRSPAVTGSSSRFSAGGSGHEKAGS